MKTDNEVRQLEYTSEVSKEFTKNLSFLNECKKSFLANDNRVTHAACICLERKRLSLGWAFATKGSGTYDLTFNVLDLSSIYCHIVGRVGLMS